MEEQSSRYRISPDSGEPLTIVILGASGDLARHKILPALFALYSQDFLPPGLRIFGFARTPMTNAEFRNLASEHLACRYVPRHSCAGKMESFLSRCFYVAGDYDSRDSMLDLYDSMKQSGEPPSARRVFYMAIPPLLFAGVSGALAGAGLVECGPGGSWPRAVIEKPFGRDRASSDELAERMEEVFTENRTYRIDHYLGKEIVQNMFVLRFANSVFEPLWNSRHVSRVEIDWREDIGVGDRGGYFDSYGIIRDVMQNHLLQILALVAMEPPSSTGAEEVRNAKVALLRQVRPLAASDLLLGQYSAGNGHAAYLAEKHVASDSITPTFCSTRLSVDNDRWRGVPFLMTAGKGLPTRESEVRIIFKKVPGNVFCGSAGCPPANRLVFRIQPDESIRLEITSLEPGFNESLVQTALDLKYKAAFSATIPEAYESLLLDVVQGDRSVFIRADELKAAWDIFTPALHECERRRIMPGLYAFGSNGPGVANPEEAES